VVSGRGGGYRGAPRGGPQGLRPRAALDMIVNGTSGPRQREQTKPATASAVPRHVLRRMYALLFGGSQRGDMFATFHVPWLALALPHVAVESVVQHASIETHRSGRNGAL
jgi:hypothetical protein